MTATLDSTTTTPTTLGTLYLGDTLAEAYAALLADEAKVAELRAALSLGRAEAEADGTGYEPDELAVVGAEKGLAKLDPDLVVALTWATDRDARDIAETVLGDMGLMVCEACREAAVPAQPTSVYSPALCRGCNGEPESDPWEDPRWHQFDEWRADR